MFFKGFFVYLCIMINDIIDKYLIKYSVYHCDGWYWVINLETKGWVLCVADSGYTFFNRDFWIMFTKFCPLKNIEMGIRNWVVYKLGVPKSKHCHPDYIPMDYDWKDEFGRQQIINVISKGLLVYGKQ